MTPQELRASILQQAIQGKLVEQRPEEGTGKELFQQIQAEKQALIKAGKIKKEKNLESFGEIEAPFDIPDSWYWCRIEDCGCFISGYTPKPNELDSVGTIPYFKVSDMNTTGNEFYLIHTNIYLRNNNAKCFMKNTIVYPKNGGAVFTNKKRVLHQDSVVDLNTGGYYPYAPLDVQYIYIYFSNIDFRKCYKGTALPTIDMDKMRSKMIPIPPLSEQKRIAAKLEEILPLIDRYEAAWNKLEEFNKRFPGDMQKSILQLAIQGKLVEQRPEEGTGEELFQQIQAEKQALIKAGKIKKEKPLPDIAEDEIPFDIPDTWKWVRFCEIASFQNGDRSKNYPNRNEYVDNGVAWINTGHITPNGYLDVNSMNYITEEKYHSLANGHIQEGDLVYCLRGATFGKTARIEPFSRGAIASSLMIIRLHNTALREYVYWYLKSPVAYRELRKYDNGSAQPNLAAKDVAKYLIPLPPLDEQKRIVAKLEEILPLCERLK